jgi:membrane associated rhomboid family serine protease
MRARAWQAFLAAGTAAVVAYFLLPDTGWQTAVNAAIGLGGVAGLLVGATLHRPRRPAVWWMLAGGLLFIAAGDSAYALYERVLHGEAPFPSVADALYLAGCPPCGCWPARARCGSSTTRSTPWRSSTAATTRGS